MKIFIMFTLFMPYVFIVLSVACAFGGVAAAVDRNTEDIERVPFAWFALSIICALLAIAIEL